ncbi:MAG TPA: hypothetical protein VGF18_06890, partial [Candidatus Tumulicola sp.]
GCGDYGSFDKSCEFSAEQSSRIARTLSARREIENPRRQWRRAIGILAIVAAALELVPSIPYAIPYAILCLGVACSELVCYIGMRQATQRRTAALVPRTPQQVLPPFVVAAVAATLLGVLLVAPLPDLRIAAVVVAVSMLVLFWIAWQVASSRALLVGDDPQIEYAIDERLRASRVANLAALAAAPAVALVGSSLPLVPADYRVVGNIAFVLTYAAFVAIAFAIVRSTRSSAAKFQRDVA